MNEGINALKYRTKPYYLLCNLTVQLKIIYPLKPMLKNAPCITGTQFNILQMGFAEKFKCKSFSKCKSDYYCVLKLFQMYNSRFVISFCILREKIMNTRNKADDLSIIKAISTIKLCFFSPLSIFPRCMFSEN
jgi:hypothetical protein